MKLTIVLIFLCILSFCVLSVRREDCCSVDAAIYMDYGGVISDLVPFVCNISSKRDAEIYLDAALALKIDSVCADGKFLGPILGEVFFDEIDSSSRKPSSSTYIYRMAEEFLISFVEFSPNDYHAVRYCLPENYEKVTVVYEIRDTKGLTGIKNTVTLYREEGVLEEKEHVNFED